MDLTKTSIDGVWDKPEDYKTFNDLMARNPHIAKVVAKSVLGYFFGKLILMFLIRTWALMIFVGILANADIMETMGYWDSFLAMGLIYVGWYAAAQAYKGIKEWHRRP